MRLIISSKEDIASKNILNKLLDYGWDELGTWRGNPLYKRNDDIIGTVNRHHIYEDDLDRELSKRLDIDFDEVVFISKHASKAGIHSLTIHPIGNFGEAKFGGKENTLVPSSPHKMTEALRILNKNYKNNSEISSYEVSFEATHHGPYLETPTFYIEIGSDKESWRDEHASSLIAKTIFEIGEIHEENSFENYPVAICIGGGHYAPRFTELALKNKISVGHMVPGWGLKFLTRKTFKEIVEKTPGAQYLYFDRSSTKGKERKRMKSWAEEEGLKVIRSSDLESL